MQILKHSLKKQLNKNWYQTINFAFLMVAVRICAVTLAFKWYHSLPITNRNGQVLLKLTLPVENTFFRLLELKMQILSMYEVVLFYYSNFNKRWEQHFGEEKVFTFFVHCLIIQAPTTSTCMSAQLSQRKECLGGVFPDGSSRKGLIIFQPPTS